MKVLASTKGDFMLVAAPDQIEAERASVVTWTGFWEQRVSLGQVEVHGRLNDEASDAGWVKVLKEATAKDPKSKKAVKAAIDAYCKEFEWKDPDAEPAKVVEPPKAPTPPAPPTT